MGIIRFLLAVAVLAEHSNYFLGFKMMSASTAVVTFYIISGFYMSLILNEKYLHGKGSYRLFITNRFLRIYPVYWIVLLFTFLVCIINRNISGDAMQLMIYIRHIAEMPAGTLAAFVFTNLFIFGQDVLSFMGFIPFEGLVFTTADNKIAATWFLLVPQAWTIAIELMFYLIAPFFVRRKWQAIAFIIILSFFLRWLLFQEGYNDNSWTKTFFPLELGFFFAGCISYNIYKRIKSISTNDILIKVSYIVFIMISLILPFINVNWYISTYAYCALAVLLVPFIFKLSKSNRIDRYIGELSYPLYITHFFTLDLCAMLDVPFSYIGIINLLLSTGLSILIIEFVSKPIESYRQARIISNAL